MDIQRSIPEFSSSKSTGIRVLFTGEYWPGSNTVYIARAFEQCGAIVRFFDDTVFSPDWNSFRGKIARRLLGKSITEFEWNHQLLHLVATFKPDLVYVTQSQYCWSQTLKLIREQSIPVMCFYHDVVWDRPDRRFAENIAEFDLVATTRRWHEAEFKAAGAKAVSIVRFGCEPLMHRPIQLDPLAIERYGAEVTFIGTHEAHRAAQLESLVSADFPYQFRLWGYWERLSADSPVRQYWQKRLIQEQEIPVIYAGSKVALHWLGWEPNGTNAALQKGDQHNSRTFQIAACGGAMMLAQRTDEHRQFFTEDVEAVYFDDVQELREKLAYWLDPAQDEARRRVAAAARTRCLKEDYSYKPVVREFLQYFRLPVGTV